MGEGRKDQNLLTVKVRKKISFFSFSNSFVIVIVTV